MSYAVKERLTLWATPPKAAVGAAVVALGFFPMACGGSSNSNQTSSPQQNTSAHSLADVCSSHGSDVGAIAGGVFAFKQAMDSGDTSALSATASDVGTAVGDLNDAASSAGISYTSAVSTFLSDLHDIAAAVNNPPADPTPFAGDQDVSKWRSDAKAVGCNIG